MTTDTLGLLLALVITEASGVLGGTASLAQCWRPVLAIPYRYRAPSASRSTSQDSVATGLPGVEVSVLLRPGRLARRGRPLLRAERRGAAHARWPAEP